jgi:HEAT repeat protein
MSERLDIEGLIKALGYEKDSDVRRKAANALGKIGDSRAVEPLIRALNDSDRDVRWHAAKALGKIGDSRAVEPLIRALNNENPYVRYGAATSLTKIGELAFEPLINALNESDSQVRAYSAKALGEIGDNRAAGPLTKALDDTCVDVSTSAKEALHKMEISRGCGIE